MERPSGVARTYALRGPEARDSTEVIIGKFSFCNHEIYALIDPGSTHSYVCSVMALNEKLPVEKLGENIEVTNPLGCSVVVNKVYRRCPIEIQSQVFPADLIELPFREFDIILGMDTLTKWGVIIDCASQIVHLIASDG